MEMQFNGMILKNKYLLVTGNRPLKSSDEGIYIFADGSEVNLNTGVIVKDTKASAPHALILQVLGPGTQTISTGVKNENPKTLSWSSLTLDIDYNGDIIVSPTSDTKITVEENEFCFTNMENDTVFITPTNYATATIDTSSNMVSNISSGNRPPLKISAPIDVNITNRSGRLIFHQLDQINLVGGSLDGVKVNKVNGITSSRTNISILDLGSLTVETSNAVTLKIGSADVVSIKSDSRVEMNVVSYIRHLTINSSSAVDVTGGNYDNLVIEKAGESLNIKKFIRIEKLTLTADSSIDIDGETADDVDIKKAGGRTTIDLIFSNSITSNSDQAIKINGHEIKTINIVYADGRVDIEVDKSESVTIKSDSAVKVSGKKLDIINIAFADGRVDIKADELSNIAVKSDSAVNISCTQGEQVVVIENDGRVDLKLAIAKSVDVQSDSSVSVSAKKYLTDPIIETTSRKTIEIRN